MGERKERQTPPTPNRELCLLLQLEKNDDTQSASN